MSCGLEHVPEWARSWCYYFAAMAFLTFLAGVMTLFVSKRLGLATTILSLTAATIQAATGMTLFWMCRKSLATSPDAKVWPTSPDTNIKTQLLSMFG